MHNCQLKLVLLLLCSCASERYSYGRSKPEIIETGYNLIRAKLNTLGLLDKYIVEMDTLSCWHWKRKDYGDSWLAELLGIGIEREDIDFYYFLTVVGKPYWKSQGFFRLTNPRHIYRNIREYDSPSGKQLCFQEVPDTTLQTVPISFVEMVQDARYASAAEKAIDIVRKTFQFDTLHPCTYALPSDYYDIKVKDYSNVSDIWGVIIEILPSDTVAYYDKKHWTGKSHQEIMQYLLTRDKTDGDCFCPQFALTARVDVRDKRVFYAHILARRSSDTGDDFAAPYLIEIDEAWRKRLQQWREENADYINSKQ